MSASGQTAKWPAVCGESAYPSISDVNDGRRKGSNVPKAEVAGRRGSLTNCSAANSVRASSISEKFGHRLPSKFVRGASSSSLCPSSDVNLEGFVERV
jgi:hypothetical protein